MSTPLTVDFGDERTGFEKKNTFFVWRYTAQQKRGRGKCARNCSFEDSKYVGPVTKFEGEHAQNDEKRMLQCRYTTRSRYCNYIIAIGNRLCDSMQCWLIFQLVNLLNVVLVNLHAPFDNRCSVTSAFPYILRKLSKLAK